MRSSEQSTTRFIHRPLEKRRPTRRATLSLRRITQRPSMAMPLPDHVREP
jgi:hypothetical protein